MSSIESPDIFTLLENMIEGRNRFLSNELVRAIPFGHRPTILARYMNNEASYMELINRIYTHNMQESQLRDAARTLISFTMPIGGTFLDPVTVAPTRTQIANSIEDFPNATSNCAICQEAISAGGCRIRQCGHVYHRACAVSWFSLSVRCPVCRYDIREANPANQTSSGEAGMSSQSSSQLEERDI
jgi:hypothetical protein